MHREDRSSIPESGSSGNSCSDLTGFTEAMIRSSEDAILGKALTGEILTWNNGAERLYGYSQAEAVGRHISLIVPKELRGELAEVDARISRNEHLRHFETVRLRKDGTRIDVSMTISPVMDKNGQVIGLSAIARDITAEKNLRRQVQESERTYRAIFESATEAIFIHEADTGRILDANPMAARLYGHEIADFRELSIADLSADIEPYTQERASALIAKAMAGQTQLFEWLAKARSGRTFWVEVSLKRGSICGEDRVLAWIRDITQQVQANKDVKLAATVFDHTLEGIFITDREGNILRVNPGFTAVTGFRPEEVLGRTPGFFKSDRHTPKFFQDFWGQLLKDGQWSGEIWNSRKNGQIYPAWLTVNAVKDEQGQVTNYVSILHDITEVKRQQAAMEFYASHDALTGLPNRQLLEDRLNMALAQAKRTRQKAAVLFFDLDHFKDVNDTMGHDTGDALLIEVTARLTHLMRGVDTVARLGGDEFVIVLPGLNDREDATTVSKRIVEAVRHPFSLGTAELFVTASIGVAIYPEDGHTPEDLIKVADTAMYRAKNAGRDNYQFSVPA